jgi:hypothetical protein
VSIESRYDSTICVQTSTVVLGGGTTWSDKTGAAGNRGYVYALSARERASIDKPTLFSTHRVLMEVVTVPVYGNRLRVAKDDGTTRYYMVKMSDVKSFSAGSFQQVDCEVVT